jgi:hypothetical protein
MAWSTCQPVTRCGSTTEPIFAICLESLNTRISADGAVAAVVVVVVAVAEEIEASEADFQGRLRESGGW